MQGLQNDIFFPYSWHVDDTETEVTSIRIYGLDENNNNTCLRIENFTPYIYIELPDNITWNSAKAQLVGNKLDEIAGLKKPLSKVLMMKKKLYGVYLNPNGERKTFPYLFCSFSNRNDIKFLSYKLKNSIHVVSIGSVRLKMHESDADPILQLTCCRQIPTAGWIRFAGRLVPKIEQLTLCDKEYQVQWKNLSDAKRNDVPHPKILSFDIEVNSTNPSAMPKAEKPGDKIFQISCVISRDGDKADQDEKYLLTLGNPDQATTGSDVLIYMYESEHDLLVGFTNFIRDENPNIIVGYNILGFDIPYMIARAKLNLCIFDFDKQGFHKTAHAKERIIKWSSSAYKNQEFEFLDAEGRLYVDLLPLVKRDYKFNNYKLKTISEYFIGESKDPLSVKGIFKCYRLGTKKNKDGDYGATARKAMGLCGKYCVQDSVLVVRLMDKLKIWVGLTEMAKTCCVSIFSLYTQGQQIKVYSQLYNYCMLNNIVVEKDGYQVAENERYVGATVFPPVPGRYKMVVPFDFASLYPTTIIAYNIDYHTWVPPGSNIPDSQCHVMDWWDHQNCCHDPKVIRKNQLTEYINAEQDKIKKLRDKRNKTSDKLRKKEIMDEVTKAVEELKPYTSERSDVSKTIAKVTMCEHRKYRFLKEPKGVMPTVIQNLLDARKHTRKVDMKKCKDEIERLSKDTSGADNTKLIKAQKSLLDVLDKRQLAYKVSCNSMYGAMGVRRGYLPFMPGAMCTTYMGRVNIAIVAETIPKKYGGELIYGDCDCTQATTPILIKNKNKIFYTTVEEISDGVWSRINPNKELSKPKNGYKIWSDAGWTNIVNIVRCGVNKPLMRVLTHVGVVTCSQEHSLLRDTLESATPLEVKITDKLCIAELPLPLDTPKVPIYDNNLTAQVIRDHVLPTETYEDLPAELAFVWGMFFADGSCGSYECGERGYIKHTWALNKKDILLLERCKDILIEHEPDMNFKIIATITQVYKLVAVQHSKTIKHSGTIVDFVNKYRVNFYDYRKYKKIPAIILTAPLYIRQSFFMGYYAGDGSKRDPAISITNKGAIGTAGLFFLLRSIGYQVSINTRADKPDVYKLTGSTPAKKMRYTPNAIKKLVPMPVEDDEYIYDIQTDNHHFSAGVGLLVVHNSNYVHFPHLTTAQETWDHAEMVALEISKLFPRPIMLEFEEEIYSFFFILSKKRYMYRKCYRDGIVEDKIGKKGVLLARRDNSKFARDVYESTITQIADNVQSADIIGYVIDQINELCSGVKLYTDFVITKAVGNCGNLQPEAFVNEKGVRKAKVGDYTVPILSCKKEERDDQIAKKGAETEAEYYLMCLPAQVQLAERMKSRGQRVDPGTRLEYVVTDPLCHTAKQYEKIESVEYMVNHAEIIKIDYLYYLKQLVNPMDQLLDVAFGKEKGYQIGMIMEQYKYRWKVHSKLIQELKALTNPILKFEK